MNRIRQLEDLFLEKLQEKYKLTERDIKKAFVYYDKDKNGILDINELKLCMQTYLNGVSNVELQSLINCYDINKTGKLSYEDFVKFLTTRSATEHLLNNNNNNNKLNNNKKDNKDNKDINNSLSKVIESNNQINKLNYNIINNNIPTVISNNSSLPDNNDVHDVQARATSFLLNLKQLLLTQAANERLRCSTAQRLGLHTSDLLVSLAKDAVLAAFQSYIHEGTFDNISSGKRYGRAPSGVSMSDFIKVLRQFTKAGASVVHVEVAKQIWSMCMNYNNNGCSELLEPDALYRLLFHPNPNIKHEIKENYITKGGIIPIDEVQMNHHDTVADSFKSHIQQQQQLYLPTSPSGSFKKIIAAPTRTLLTVPTNFEPLLVQNSSRLPNYECIMEHVFGLSNHLYSNKNIFVTSDNISKKPLLVYTSAAVGIMHDPTTNKQVFLNGHTDDITCIAMSYDTKILATGQIGKNPFINIWNLKSLSCTDNNKINDLYISKEQVLSTKDGPIPSNKSSAWLCTIGGENGISSNFFQRGICSIELSPNGNYLLGIGCDDKHRMGIWDLTKGGLLICDTVTQNGIPPQIKGVFWCPLKQSTSDFITREHCGQCDMFVTIGFHHLKFWSFASTTENFILNTSNTSNNNNNNLINRTGKIDKKLNISPPSIYLCGTYIINVDGIVDFVTGGSNGIVYLYREGDCIAFNIMGKKSTGSSQVIVAPNNIINNNDNAMDVNNITNPHAIFSILAIHNLVICGGKDGTIHCLDNHTLQKLTTLSLFDTNLNRPISSVSSKSNNNNNNTNINVNILITGLVVLTPDHNNISEISSKVSKKEKHLRIVATTDQGVAKYITINISSTGSLSFDKLPIDLFHYHTNSLWGLAVDKSRHNQIENKLIITAGDDKIVAVWDTKTWKQLCSAKTQAAAKCCYLDETLKYIGVGLSNGGILLYTLHLSNNNTTTNNNSDIKSTISDYSNRSRPISANVINNNNSNNNNNNNNNKLSANIMERVYRKDSNNEISDIKFDSTGNKIVIGSHDRCIYLYEIIKNNKNNNINYNLKLNFKLQGHNSYITHLDFSTDNQMLRSTCGAYELLFWDCNTGKQITSSFMNESWRTNTVVLGFEVMGIWPLGSDGTDVNALDVCKESNIVATADDFGTLKLFNYPCIVKHSPGRVYGGHCSHITNIRFYNGNNSSTYITTTGGNDAALIVWKVKPIS